MVLILFAIGAIYLFVDEYYHPVVELSEQDIAFIDSLLVRHETNEIDVKKESQSHSQKSKPTLNPKYYDPNTVSHCLLYTSPSPRDRTRSRMPSSA